MKSANMTRNRSQVHSVGNYLMTGKILGKGHFARVEEATHRVLGKKVAIKIIDLTLIKEEYARRNLHREPRVMARLRHPCIAALYETMMAAGGGDLCSHVLTARGGARGLPETRARCLGAQLVSAVKHMHDRGVVHRDLKMENIMLDSTKQFIKIVDFGLSNLWSAGGALRTPCGSLEYAAPELLAETRPRRYGPEVDLWSIGVIVFGMVTGGLPFAGGEAGGETRDRPLLRRSIARGYAGKQRAALVHVSEDCKCFIQHLLEPDVGLRMKIDEAMRSRWLRRPGMRIKTHPFSGVDPGLSREIFKQISELSSQSIMDIVAQIKADPFGDIAGMYNIKTHQHQLQSMPVTDLLWSNLPQDKLSSPPVYRTFDSRTESSTNNKAQSLTSTKHSNLATQTRNQRTFGEKHEPSKSFTTALKNNKSPSVNKNNCVPSERLSIPERVINVNFSSVNRLARNVNDSGDCSVSRRLPSIDEHSCVADSSKHRGTGSRLPKAIVKSPRVRKTSLDEGKRLNSCPSKIPENKINDFYRRGGDGIPSWRASAMTPPARVLHHSNTNSCKRASLGNMISPHSSTNSQCKSERAISIGWCTRVTKEVPHLQRFRRNAPTK